VEFDGAAALSVTYVSPTRLRAVVPAHALPPSGVADAVEARRLTTTVDVTVIDGPDSETLPGGYVYGPLDPGRGRGRKPAQ
jgi:hypothetical protein